MWRAATLRMTTAFDLRVSRFEWVWTFSVSQYPFDSTNVIPATKGTKRGRLR